MSHQTFALAQTTTMLGRTRAFLKIQDGCDRYCSYCAVPYARGKNRSCLTAAVLEQAQKLTDHGYREIVLGGVNLGLYQDDACDLATLIRQLESISGLDLIRLSSMEPETWTPALTDLIASSDKLCPHVHIPVQSGCDAVLQRMRRRSGTTYIANLLQRLCKAREDIAIGLDVICGFPGETDDEFEQTFLFISSIPVAYLHVFPYSKRKDTPAALMPGQVHGSIIKERVERLLHLSDHKTDEFCHKLISGSVTLRGLIESSYAGIAEALSDHYVRSYIYADSEVAPNLLWTLKPVEHYKDGLRCIIL